MDEMELSKSAYLNDVWSKRFVHYLADLITAREHLSFSMPHPNEPGPRVERIERLEEAYRKYEWRGDGYDETAIKIEKIRLLLQGAHDANSAPRFVQGITECMNWGLGGKAREHNIRWARGKGNELPRYIGQAISIINDDDPDIRAFNSQLRMNSGYTKVYALLARRSLIYDGRVGAALGYLVRTLLERSDDSHVAVPAVLSFPWSNGRSTRLRNPSSRKYHFPQLRAHGATHARWNIRANWIVASALDHASLTQDSGWHRSSDAFRRVEAALFMIGFDLGPQLLSLQEVASDR